MNKQISGVLWFIWYKYILQPKKVLYSLNYIHLSIYEYLLQIKNVRIGHFLLHKVWFD